MEAFVTFSLRSQIEKCTRLWFELSYSKCISLLFLAPLGIINRIYCVLPWSHIVYSVSFFLFFFFCFCVKKKEKRNKEDISGRACITKVFILIYVSLLDEPGHYPCLAVRQPAQNLAALSSEVDFDSPPYLNINIIYYAKIFKKCMISFFIKYL